MSNIETKAFINPYDLFNLDEKCTAQELRKEYYNMCLMCHPDKGGSEKDMSMVTSAYNFIKQYTNDGNVNESYEDVENAFAKFNETNPIEKIPSFEEIFTEATKFNDKFNKEFVEKHEQDKLSSLGYDKIMVKSSLQNHDNIDIKYNELLGLEKLDKYDAENVTTDKLETLDEIHVVTDEYKNKFNRENQLYLNNPDNLRSNDLPNDDGIYKPDYPDNKKFSSLILANDGSYGEYYDFSIEEDLEKMKNLEDFPDEDILKKLNVDYSGKNFSDYHQNDKIQTYDPELHSHLQSKFDSDLSEKITYNADVNSLL
jgi:hypothetical protein